MRMFGTTLGVFFFSGILPLAPSPVFAQGTGSASTQRLASEYQRLRADLDRVNAEVAALKRGGRGVRADYLLRDKMAEAEALARKVTAAEARLRAARGPLPAETLVDTVQTPPATPRMAPSNWRPRRTSCLIRRVAFALKPKPWRIPQNRSEPARPCVGVPVRGTATHSPVLRHPNASRSFRRKARTRWLAAIPAEVPRPTRRIHGQHLRLGRGESAVPAAGPSTPPPRVGGPGAVSSPSPSVAPSATSHPLTAPAPASTDASSKTSLQQRTLLIPPRSPAFAAASARPDRSPTPMRWRLR